MMMMMMIENDYCYDVNDVSHTDTNTETGTEVTRPTNR